ncbi:MAG: hypothetical protein ISR77_35960 [Pirellulaceae bacterium]|nr:hypothetical protein [Pirellulaceae bacterium]
MRLRISFGKDGFKGFFSQHAEKAIFGLVLFLVGWFIYYSATQDVDETGSPEDLKKNAETAKTALDTNYWDAIKEDREKKVEDYPGMTEVARNDIEEKDYALANIWDGVLFASKAKRGDPQMLTPEIVEASGGFFNVPMRTTNRRNPWEDDKDAVEQPKEKPKPKRPKKDRSRGRQDEGSDEGMLAGGMDGMDGMGGSYYEGVGAENEDESFGGDSTYMDGMMGEGASSADTSSSMAGGRKAIGSVYKKLYIRGHQGTFGQGTVGRSLAIVSVKALVPYEKQWEEYQTVLAEARGYVASQDIPKYLFFLAERAEVPADPNAPLEWKLITTSEHAMKTSSKFAGRPKDMADPAYTIPGVLTMPLPPVMLKPYDDLALHSEIPRQQLRRARPVDRREEADEELADVSQTDLSEGINSIRKGATGRTGMGTGMPYGDEGGGMPYGDEGGGMPYGDEGGGMPYGDEGGGMPYGDEGGGMPYGDEGGGMPYGDEGGDGYGYSYGGGPRQPLVKHKMVRFFDFTAEPGKSYRYRVSVVLEDPNRPREANASPDKRILEQAVVQRLEQIESADAAKNQRTFYIQTDWSEPSDVVTVAKPEEYVAGSATQGRVIPLGNGIKVQTTESKGKVVTMVWDDDRAAEVPAEREVYRGSFLDFTQDADALNPLNLQIKTIEGYHFATDAFVADLRGGEELITDVEKVDKEEIETKHYAPAEFLVIDGQGNLVACNEIDDTEEYRRLMFIEDKEGTEMGGGMSGYGDMGGDMGGGYEEMMQEGANYMGEDGS